MAVGGINRYPSLESIANLFRASVNDSFTGANGDPGEGLIMTDSNPDLLTFMNSAIRDTYSDLRNVGDPALILDNYLLFNIPPLTQPDPAVQVSLDSVGYFDGFMFNPQWTLPSGCMRVERIWERPNGTNANFEPMTPCPFGLPGTQQTQRMGYWETRQNAIWMPGCLIALDLRLRCLITFPDFLGTEIDFTTTYVPILDCTNTVVAKMMRLYARRFAPDLLPGAIQDDKEYTGKLRLEVVRNMQNTEYQRAEWGTDATSSYGWLNVSL